MVTKRHNDSSWALLRLILAKNHMVTKPSVAYIIQFLSLILAKNHMVTKLLSTNACLIFGLILAKNHMVTKHTLTAI